MLRFVKASPSEFLVISRNGEATSAGLAASAFVWPGASWVLVPATKMEATFEMTQETRDGLPLRFKGIVLYHVEDPVRAARAFDFTTDGPRQIQSLISHICLGELRSTVAHMTMQQCIEQRKTTLTDAVTKLLSDIVGGAAPASGGAGRPWGIALDVVQVAQVFIVDPELRRQLEAEVRNQIKATSDLAALEAAARVAAAQAVETRRARAEQLETERQASTIQAEEARLQSQLEAEKARLQSELEAEKLRAAEPVELLAIASRRKLSHERLELLQAERALRQLEVEIELAPARASQDLRREILPIEQAPEVARALAGILAGARLSIVAGDATPLAGLAPLAEYLRGLIARASDPE